MSQSPSNYKYTSNEFNFSTAIHRLTDVLYTQSTGPLITRQKWIDSGEIKYLQAINPHSNCEYIVTERAGMTGTLTSYISALTKDNRRYAWTPTSEDMFAKDYIEITLND